MSRISRIFGVLFPRNMHGMQRYYTEAGQSPRQAKQSAEAFHVFIQAEWMHLITLLAAMGGMLVPSLVFNAPAGVSMMWGGAVTLASIIVGLLVTHAWRRPMFVVGYSITALLCVVVACNGYVYNLG